MRLSKRKELKKKEIKVLVLARSLMLQRNNEVFKNQICKTPHQISLREEK